LTLISSAEYSYLLLYSLGLQGHYHFKNSTFHHYSYFCLIEFFFFYFFFFLIFTFASRGLKRFIFFFEYAFKFIKTIIFDRTMILKLLLKFVNIAIQGLNIFFFDLKLSFF
jgi:hypothetical protein